MAKKNERDTKRCHGGVTRRGFLASVGASTVGAVVASRAAAAPAQQRESLEGMVPCTLKINGRHHSLLVEPRWSLLYVLREELGLTGTKQGCERGECGACTVLVDGVARYACLTLALEVQGHAVTTVEGLVVDGQLSAVQQAFVAEDAFQCGYCTPGQVMAAEALLRANPAPSDEEIREGMSGNLCRCGAYDHIVKAVRRAAAARRAGGAR
ncbi:MAG: (2Fe-2S)-binding protein [Thermoanaerobaculaceae bacterium]|nr:(2Fe-2S)-binding protein [Thermoanaerobaculaceae bacterium]